VLKIAASSAPLAARARRRAPPPRAALSDIMSTSRHTTMMCPLAVVRALVAAACCCWLCCAAAAHAVNPQQRHRLQPSAGRVIHMAGQSPGEFQGYSSFLPAATRPAVFTTYFRLEELLEDDQKAERYLTETRDGLDKLGDSQHVVLPHISLDLTTHDAGGHTDGRSVPAAVIAGRYDGALRRFADAVPLLGRPLFLRIGYEFNGHWNNYSAPDYLLAWRRIEHVLAANATTRDTVALVWDMSCDAVARADPCTTAAECWKQFWPGNDVVDWVGVNVFQSGRGRNFSSMPNSSCVLGFADEAARRGWPVLIAESMPRFYPTSERRSWDAWFAPFFNQLMPHPAVQGWSYIDRDCSNGSRTRKACVGGLWGGGRPFHRSVFSRKFGLECVWCMLYVSCHANKKGTAGADARVEPPAAAYVGARYRQAIAQGQGNGSGPFVHGGTLADTCVALGVRSCSPTAAEVVHPRERHTVVFI
jgi:hypothetical protein